jgi:hypothetical protein
MNREVLGQLQGGGYKTVESVAREEDLERMAAQAGFSSARAANLRHYARIYLGEIPEGTPPPAREEAGLTA